MREHERRQKILIVDDSEINRSILADMLGDEYEIIEAENGVQAVALLQKQGVEISLVLLDIVMPEMDGFGVLAMMNQTRLIEDVPVIMISAEGGSSHIERAYELGVIDFITRPFDALIVHRRVVNTILLYAKQKKLVDMVADQIYEKEQRSGLMIDILSHIVEFRNGESGLHVVHVRTLTEILLRRLIQRTDRYHITPADITIIGTASALHDIGKISIDEKILNKPGRLTPEEFDIMKTHSLIGAEMLENLPVHQGETLVKFAYEICRWHHERYDGRGYPDGLKGDEIPVSAQIVAMADVYDALTSKRVYKPPFTHETAVQMILDGQCGAFNPLLLECLTDVEGTLQKELRDDALGQGNSREMRSVVQEISRHEELTASERTLQLLDYERMKYNFFASMTEEIQFEYTLQPPMVTLSPLGAEKLGLGELIMEPLEDGEVSQVISQTDLRTISDMVRTSSPDQPVVKYDCKLHLSGGSRWFRIISRAMWSADEPPRYTGAIGKVMDIHESRTKLDELEQMASHDTLTGLLNHAYAKKRILERLEGRPGSHFALAIFDLDRFKDANDTYGHRFGDQVLIYVAERLRQSIRSGDIAARVGGDEFLIFLEYGEDEELHPVIERIFTSLCGSYEQFDISVSLGVVRTITVGTNYDTLFQAADQALYSVKRSGRSQFRFYNESMREMLSVISPIDSETE
ncbi:MAG: diguanylate cyclase [Oscillibacter sp.]|nr:diguanylate cyclase [Oscillibacter sp.]